MKIAVVGAGVLGLSAAVSLTERGHEVEVLERTAPFAGASHRSFAWLNANNHPIVGFLDDARKVYAVVTHSGMTLAPLLGRLTAEELGGRESELLTDFRPSRFTDGVVQPADWDYFIGRQ